jgi:uncharacterized protein
MAHPNEDLVRRAYDAFSQGDIETLRQLFADDTIFHEPGRNPVSGDYQGIDQVLAFFGTLAERSGGTFRVTLHDAVASDEHGLGVHVSEGEREGRRLHSLQTVVFHVRDGKVAEAWALHYDQHATDEFWATGAAIRGCRALGVRARVEAHRMATGPLLGRGEDAESIEDNRFISPTDTRGA